MAGTERQRAIAKAVTLLIPLAPWSDAEAIREQAAAKHMKTLPPSVAVWLTACAISLADSARLALSTTVAESVSIVAEVSSIVAACLVVRSLRSLAPE